MTTEISDLIEQYADENPEENHVTHSQQCREDHGGLDTLTRFLEEGFDTGIRFNGGILIWDEDDRCYVVEGNLVYYLDDIDDFFWDQTTDLDAEPCAILIQKRKGFDVVHNGDEENVYHTFQDQFPDAPTVSVQCIKRLLGLEWEGGTEALAKLVKAKKVVFVDYVPDSILPVTAKQRRQYRASVEAFRKQYGYGPTNSRDMAPNGGPCGYTFMPGGSGVAYKWHRAATVVLRDTRKKGASYMLGQDEDTYFGLQLPGHPKTIDKAFESLVPRSIRKVDGVKRQGEWFCVPLSEDQVPPIHECVEVSEAVLPKDDADSNDHTVGGNPVMVGNDGTVYAHDGQLIHTDHESINMKGWCKYVVSTAVRSVSVEGED